MKKVKKEKNINKLRVITSLSIKMVVFLILGGLAAYLGPSVVGFIAGVGTTGPIAGGFVATSMAGSAAGIAGGGLAAGSAAAAIQSVAMAGASLSTIAYASLAGAAVDVATRSASQSTHAQYKESKELNKPLLNEEAREMDLWTVCDDLSEDEKKVFEQSGRHT